MKIYFLIFWVLMATAGGQRQIIPFDSDKWEITARESSIEHHLGRRSLRLQGGQAVVKDSEFKNGIIEFDIAFGSERAFTGVMWRLQDARNFEDFYMRPHQSGKADANQYTPVFNGISGWQLYHGEGYGAEVDYSFNEWIHVKTVVSGKDAEVYIHDMDKPILVMHDLKREVKAGRVGLKASNLAPIHFSGFSFKAIDNPPVTKQTREPEQTPAGTIMSWLVSEPFEEKSLEDKFHLMQQDKKTHTWRRLTCEPSGTANLARLQGTQGDSNTVFAKAVISSDKEQYKKLGFGFSDRVKVYCNDRLIYSGNNTYRSRDFRFLGTIGYFDEVVLPLKKGDNELLFVISETFGGWGVKAKFEDLAGVSLKF